MKRGLVVFVLVVILIVSVFANSEISEEKSVSDTAVNEDNSVSDVQDDTNSDINDETVSDDSNSQISPSDVVPDSNSADIPDDTQTNSNENNNEEKITICHKPGTPAEKTLEIPEEALEGHLNHGDYIGGCESRI